MGSIDKSLLNDITALADNELKDEQRREELLALIAVDEEVRFEYELQLGMKKLLKEKLQVKLPTAALQSSIKDRINTEMHRKEKKKSKVLSFFKKSRYAVPAVVVLAMGFLFSYVFLRDADIEPLLQEQTGENNMVVQAQENFKMIKNGLLELQFESNDPEKLKNFFSENGVNYTPEIPTYENWNLAGGVVSDHGGHKLAHNVYTSDNGKLIYLYQANTAMCKKHKAVLLSDDLIQSLDEGKVFSGKNRGYCIFVWQTNSKIFVLVSNEEMQKLEQNFLAGI